MRFEYLRGWGKFSWTGIVWLGFAEGYLHFNGSKFSLEKTPFLFEQQTREITDQNECLAEVLAVESLR